MKFPSLARRAWRGLAVALLGAGLLSACGGSTSQYNAFIPGRLVVFGDEYSTLYDPSRSGNGRTYAMNGLDASDTTNQTIQCYNGNTEIWVQSLAQHYGMTFKECNPSNLADDRLHALMQAGYGATVRAVVQQIDDFQANIAHDALNASDMVTVLVGLHDIIEIYKDNLTFVSEDEKLAEAEARGRIVAAQVNRMAALGARVLVAQEIDVGLSPYALNEGASEAALLTRITDAFNKGIRLDLLNDGTKIGLLAFDDALRNLSRYGGYNNSDLGCDNDHIEPVSVVDSDSNNYIDGGGLIVGCTTATISADNAATHNVWADSLHVNARLGHARFGSLAVARASANPF